MYKINKCPKCGGNLIKGILVDKSYGGYLESEWAEGIENKIFILQYLKNKKKVISYRCEQCGYLELFAN